MRQVATTETTDEKPTPPTEDELLAAVEHIKNVARFAMLIPVETARAIVSQRLTEDTLMPLLDPTRWRDTHEQTDWHIPYLQAFAAYRTTLEKLKNEEESGKAGSGASR